MFSRHTLIHLYQFLKCFSLLCKRTSFSVCFSSCNFHFTYQVIGCYCRCVVVYNKHILLCMYASAITNGRCIRYFIHVFHLVHCWCCGLIECSFLETVYASIRSLEIPIQLFISGVYDIIL